MVGTGGRFLPPVPTVGSLGTFVKEVLTPKTRNVSLVEFLRAESSGLCRTQEGTIIVIILLSFGTPRESYTTREMYTRRSLSNELDPEITVCR